MSEGEDELYSEYDQIPAHGDGPASNTPTTTDFPASSAGDSNVPGRKRWQFFREGVVSGASESGASETWFTSGKLSSTPLLYSPNNDAIGEPAAPRGGRRASA
jgi:hypothetical protein